MDYQAVVKSAMDYKAAVESVDNCEGFKVMIQAMFHDNVYTLSRGYVLQVFTDVFIEFRPLIAKEIRTIYNNFIYENYHPLEFLNLCLWRLAHYDDVIHGFIKEAEQTKHTCKDFTAWHKVGLQHFLSQWDQTTLHMKKLLLILKHGPKYLKTK